MRAARRVLGAVGVAARLTMVPDLVAAADPPSADVAAAQALFERGRQLMADQRPREACPLFEESQRLDAGLGTRYHLAHCYEVSLRYASAYTLFLDIAAAARARGQSERARVAASRAEAVAPKVSHLIIEVEHEQRSALTVERDGSIVGPPQWGLPVPVDPGPHDVRAYGPGLVPWQRVVNVGESARSHTVRIQALTVAQSAARASGCDEDGVGCGSATTAPASDSPRLARSLGFVALGMGVASLGVAAGLAVRAHSKNERSEDAGCDDRGCPDQASLELRREAVAAGNWATAGTGLGLAGIGAAGILIWLVPAPRPDSEARALVVPRLTPHTAGLEFSGHF